MLVQKTDRERLTLQPVGRCRKLVVLWCHSIPSEPFALYLIALTPSSDTALLTKCTSLLFDRLELGPTSYFHLVVCHFRPSKESAFACFGRNIGYTCGLAFSFE